MVQGPCGLAKVYSATLSGCFRTGAADQTPARSRPTHQIMEHARTTICRLVVAGLLDRLTRYWTKNCFFDLDRPLYATEGFLKLALADVLPEI